VALEGIVEDTGDVTVDMAGEGGLVGVKQRDLVVEVEIELGLMLGGRWGSCRGREY
jgi:hypothetical protein